MAHFAADRPLAAAPGDALQLLVGNLEHHLGRRGPHRRAPASRTPASCTAASSVRSACASADPEFDEAGTWVGLVLPARHGARLRALRAALPARRRVGRRPPPAGRAGWTTARTWVSDDPEDGSPYGAHWWGVAGDTLRHLPRLGLRGPVDHHLPAARPRRGAPRQDARSSASRPSVPWRAAMVDAFARRPLTALRAGVRLRPGWRRRRGSAGPSSPGTRRRAGRRPRPAPTTAAFSSPLHLAHGRRAKGSGPSWIVDLVGMRHQVVEPLGVLGRTALGRDQRVLAAVLDPHDGVLAHLAALGAAGGHDDDGHPGVEQRVGPLPARTPRTRPPGRAPMCDGLGS